MNNKIKLLTIIGGISMFVIVVLIIIVIMIQQRPVPSTTPSDTPVAPTSLPYSPGGNRSTSTPEQSSDALSPTVPVVTIPTNDNAHNLELGRQLYNQPDMYVSNYLPYETNDFSANFAYTQTPTDHFYFIVTAKNDNTPLAMQKFQAWLLSLGLTQQQITQLDIRYQ